MRQWRDSGDVTSPMSAEDLAGDALVHLTERLASVVPMKGSFLVLGVLFYCAQHKCRVLSSFAAGGLNKPVGSVLVGNHRMITSRWLELSRIAANTKKHNAHLNSLRARSRAYASDLQTSSQVVPVTSLGSPFRLVLTLSPLVCRPQSPCANACEPCWWPSRESNRPLPSKTPRT